jgi:transcription-repair coupling factor (superfamily II helicase)
VAGEDALKAIREELRDRYGNPPEVVDNLLAVAKFRLLARRAGLTEVSAQGNHIRFGPIDLPESAQLRLKRLYPNTLLKPAVNSVLVPRPTTARIGGQPLRNVAVLEWAAQLIEAVVLNSVSAAAGAATR